MSAMPSLPTSSSRPTKGEMKLAPAFAASSACAAEKHVDHRAFVGECAAGLEAVGRQRHLDRDIARELRELAPFGQHRSMIRRRHFGAHRSRHDTADLAHDLEEVAPGLRHQRRIRGDAVDEPGRREVADLRDVGSVDEKLHPRRSPPACFRAAGTRAAFELRV
jgi:hypothetical protein